VARELIKPPFVLVERTAAEGSSIYMYPSGCPAIFSRVAPGTTADWTGGYAKGSTSLTLSNTANLQVGSTLVLDQINDNGDADPGNDVYDCTLSPTCTQAGSAQHGHRCSLSQATSVSGLTVGITPLFGCRTGAPQKAPSPLDELSLCDGCGY